MRILVVSQCFYPDDFRINDIVRSLVSEGHTVRVLTGLPDYATSHVPKAYRLFRKRREDWSGARVVRVPTVSRRSGVLFRSLNYLSFVISGWLYVRFCSRDADVVLSYQTSPVLQAAPAVAMKKRAGIPLVLYCCDLWPESLKAWNVPETNPLYRLMHRVSRRLYGQCDRIAVTSRPFRDYLREVNGIPESRMVYLPQHAEDLYGSISGCYEENGVTDFLFAGNIGAVQNVDCLIRAAAAIPGDRAFHVHIVGSGSALAECEQLAWQLGVDDHVTFHGKFPLPEMERFYRLADCFVLTLRGGDFIGKTLPAKAQGYLCAGKPLVGAIDGAGAELIAEADCGLCVPAGDEQGLAKAMMTVMDDAALYRRKGLNGRTYYEQHFTRDQFMRSLNSILDTTVNG